MVKTVYIDVLFIINFIINYLILFTCTHIHTIHFKRYRILGGAFLSAVYGVFAFFPSLSFATSFLFKMLISVIIVLISFGYREILRNTLSFFSISLAFGGFVFAISLLDGGNTFELANGIYYIHISLPLLISSTALCYAILSLIFGRTAKKSTKEIYDVTLSDGKRKVSLRALHDTGNSLRAPKTNAPVLICDYLSVRELFPENVREIFDGKSAKNFPLLLDRLSEHGTFGLLPYKSVGVSFSTLLTYRPERLELDRKTVSDALIAFSDSPVSDGGAYSALI